MTLSVALATSRKYAALIPEDRLLCRALERQGVRARPAVWDDPEVDWKSLNGVVIRSCWDYHLRTGEFLDWVARLEHLRVPLCNPPQTIRWNHDKRYLRELSGRGVPVAPTVWIEPDAPWREQLREFGWESVIVKPVVSASAHGLRRLPDVRAESAVRLLEEAAARAPLMVQPYLEEIAGGEWSLVFLGGEFSHAVLKRPRAGDFRVQKEFGGSVAALEPPPALVDQAAGVLEALPEAPGYARVDGVRRDGRLVLLELELIEPELYLETRPDAAERFAGVLTGFFAEFSARG